MNQEEIQLIYQEFRVPHHVIKHMQQVAKVADALAKAFFSSNIEVDHESLNAAALLHDTMRICDFREFDPEKIPQNVNNQDIEVWTALRYKYKKIGHAKAMHDYLIKKNKPKIANLVKKHDFSEIDNLSSWEEKLIYYSDKRVDHDKIVTLKMRLEEGEKRNKTPDDKKDIRQTIVNKLHNLEDEIREAIGELPEFNQV